MQLRLRWRSKVLMFRTLRRKIDIDTITMPLNFPLQRRAQPTVKIPEAIKDALTKASLSDSQHDALLPGCFVHEVSLVQEAWAGLSKLSLSRVVG